MDEMVLRTKVTVQQSGALESSTVSSCSQRKAMALRLLSSTTRRTKMTWKRRAKPNSNRLHKAANQLAKVPRSQPLTQRMFTMPRVAARAHRIAKKTVLDHETQPWASKERKTVTSAGQEGASFSRAKLECNRRELANDSKSCTPSRRSPKLKEK